MRLIENGKGRRRNRMTKGDVRILRKRGSGRSKERNEEDGREEEE